MPLANARVSFVLLLALAAGCGGSDDIKTYTVPKTPEGRRPTPDAGGPEPTAGEYRILGGIYPSDDPAWFFKFPGATDELAKYDADFDKLLASVSLPPTGPPEFVVPDGWKRGPGRAGIVVATIKTPDGKHEVSVSSSGGGVAGNLSRWAEQLGTGFGPADVTKVTKPIDAKGVKGLRVDMRGPKKPPVSGMGGPMTGGK